MSMMLGGHGVHNLLTSNLVSFVRICSSFSYTYLCLACKRVHPRCQHRGHWFRFRRLLTRSTQDAPEFRSVTGRKTVKVNDGRQATVWLTTYISHSFWCSRILNCSPLEGVLFRYDSRPHTLASAGTTSPVEFHAVIHMPADVNITDRLAQGIAFRRRHYGTANLDLGCWAVEFESPV